MEKITDIKNKTLCYFDKFSGKCEIKYKKFKQIFYVGIGNEVTFELDGTVTVLKRNSSTSYELLRK